MNWVLFGVIWSFEMVVVLGYLAASGNLSADNCKTDNSRSCSGGRTRTRSAGTC